MRSFSQNNPSQQAHKSKAHQPDSRDSAMFSSQKVSVPSTFHLGKIENQISLLKLQQESGNQQACRMLKSSHTGELVHYQNVQRQIQRAPTQVSNNISDNPYRWTSSYEVEFTKDTCQLNVKVKLAPDAGISESDLKRVQNETSGQFQNVFDNRFRLTDVNSSQVYQLRVNLVFVASGQHLTVSVHAGQGRDNLSNWYVDSEPIDRAHEMGHQIGLKDEYIDATATNRQNSGAPGVATDHSIMGNYYDEGIDVAEAKQRHGDTIAGHIGGSTGRSFNAAMNTTPALLTQLIDINKALEGIPSSAAKEAKETEKRTIENELRKRKIEIIVRVLSTEDILGADEVYVKLVHGSQSQTTPVNDLNDGQSHIFVMQLAPLLPLGNSINVEVYDEDWPDGDDIIVRIPWTYPFAPSTNSQSFDGANYRVTARFQL